MSIKTQGTDLFIIDPENGELLEIACTTSIDSAGATRAVFTIPPCLSDTTGAASKSPGELTPATLTFGLNADPTEPSHLRLHELLVEGTEHLQFALGWSDGTANPTLASPDAFVLPTSRTWLTFTGFVSAFPFNFAANAVVATTVTVELEQPEVWTAKA